MRRRMGCPADRPMLWKVVFFMVVLLCSLSSGRATYEDCPCNKVSRPYGGSKSFDNVEVGQHRQLHCCVFGVFGFHDPDAVIKWAFEGKPLTRNMPLVGCRNETLEITSAREVDDGVYTCTITTSNGTTRTHLNGLSVCPTSGHRTGPVDVKAGAKTVCAREGGEVKLTCEGMVGKPGCDGTTGDISWWALTPEDKMVFPPRDVKTSDSIPRINGYGIMRTSLIFDSVTEAHFGTYLCRVKNSYGYAYVNVTLVEGDPLYCGSSNVSLLVLTTVVAATGVALCVLYCWWRCRMNVAIRLMEKKGKALPADGFLHDVFVVYGESATTWVNRVLLQKLENDYNYSCFNPFRDMKGGEQFAEAIASAMSKCRRVLVVITPGLLRSQWATWTVHHGIRTCLTSATRILAIVLQDFGSDAISSETTGLLKTLEAIKRIQVPNSCVILEEDEEEEENKKEEDPESLKVPSENVQKMIEGNYLKIRLPDDLNLENSNSNLSRNQCLSNMVTGSNNASRENLNEGKDSSIMSRDQGKDVGRSVIYVEDADVEDPGSPCSNTPFILTTCGKQIKQTKDSRTSNPLFKCLRYIFVGDPEIVFWQRVRLRLELPSVRRRKNTVESTI